MRHYSSGQSAPWGVYVSPRALDARVVNADGEPLEGKPGARYLRVPSILVVVASLALGATFAMGFPLLILAAFVVGTVQVFRARAGALDEHGAPQLASAAAEVNESADVT